MGSNLPAPANRSSGRRPITVDLVFIGKPASVGMPRIRLCFVLGIGARPRQSQSLVLNGPRSVSVGRRRRLEQPTKKFVHRPPAMKHPTKQIDPLSCCILAARSAG